MVFLESIRIKNGDGYSVCSVYECDGCMEKINVGYPYIEDGEHHLCPECAYIHKVIDEERFLFIRHHRIGGEDLFKYNATIINRSVVVWSGDSPPWAATNSDSRRTKEYRVWRKSVLERDEYTCQHCGSEDDLHAHHIKDFANHEDLRYEVSNGLTLCESCHRDVHRKG